MKIWSDDITAGARMPDEFCFCRPNAETHVELAPNRNPHLAWEGAPEGTQSYVVVMHDPDVPTVGDDVNQEERTVPHDLPRTDFFHWVLVDINANTTQITAGSHSDGITPRGKDGPDGPQETRHGTNDYTGWFAGDADMAGSYFGYDGPCPPWNDERLHRYCFTVFALDTDICGVSAEFTGADVREAIDGHVLDRASLEVTYSLNPAVFGQG